MTHTKGERSRENNFGLEQKDKQGGRWRWTQTASPEPPQSTSAAPQKLVQVYKRQALIFKINDTSWTVLAKFLVLTHQKQVTEDN